MIDCEAALWPYLLNSEERALETLSSRVPESPEMWGPETDCLISYMRKSRRYLEFGSGGSTILAAKLGVPTLHSVESDRAWGEAVKQSPIAKPRFDDGSFKLQWVDIGETKEWGFPKSSKDAVKWPAFSLSVWDELSFVPDFVLVDGRFRVSCALQSIARCDADTLFAVHDFERDDYQPILRHAEIVTRAERLIILKRKGEIDPFQFGIDCAEHLLKTW